MAATTQSQSLGFASATATESSTSSPEITSAPSSSSRSSSSDSSLSSSSSSRPPQVYTVKAGAGGFKFDPQTLEDVNVGDIVTFEFYPPDHSVARAEFGSACVPYEYTGKGKTGFWSDTQWVKDVDHLQYYNVTVNSSEPIFFYCAAPASCTDHQMVGVINPNDTQTLQKQIDSAKEATFQVKPGDPVPAEASASLHASATAAPPSTPTPHGHILSGGAIAGIVVGGVAFLALCAALFFYVGRTKSLKEVIKHRESTIQSPAPTNSHFPHSPGYPPAQFSPNMQHAEAGMGGSPLPAYGQHNATDANYYGGYSPQPPQGQGQMAEVKHELASPAPGQQTFSHELEAPVKPPS